MNRQPKLMNLPRMRHLLGQLPDLLRSHLHFNDELGIVHGSRELFQLAMKQNPPFAIDDYRFGIILKGEVHINFNLTEKHLKAGTLVFIGPGTIISPVSFSPDLEVLGMVLFASFPMPFASGQMPSAFIGQMRDFQLQASSDDIQIASLIIHTIWQLIQSDDYHRPTVGSLVAALMNHYDALYARQTERQEASLSREQTIFDRFLYLVNRHAADEHKISFYAERMCLTERYLGTIVRQASGVTAKEWIDRALITRIKVELHHTGKSVAQISEEMHFPNPSFFSKYFHRLTGMTPLEFRVGK